MFAHSATKSGLLPAHVDDANDIISTNININTNTAGEEMDLLRAGGDYGDLDDRFRTLDESEQSADEHETARRDINHLEARSATQRLRAVLSEHAELEHESSEVPVAGVHQSSDGDVEDNATSEVEEHYQPAMSLRPRVPKPVKEFVALRPGEAQKPASSTTSRQSQRQQKRKIAGLRSQASTNNAAGVKGANYRGPISRVTSHRNAKGSSSDKQVSKRAKAIRSTQDRVARGSKAGLCLRNWKGESITNGEGFVLIPVDEVDATRFKRID